MNAQKTIKRAAKGKAQKAVRGIALRALDSAILDQDADAVVRWREIYLRTYPPHAMPWSA